MDNIQEEFEKIAENMGYTTTKENGVYIDHYLIILENGYLAGRLSLDEEIKKLNYKIDGMESDIRARVEIRRDLINKNKELNYLLKNLYENRYESDKLYIYMKKVKEVIGLWIK